MLTAGTIINGGLRLVRERPVSVAIWGLVYLGATIVGGLLLVLPLLRMRMEPMQGGQFVPPDPMAMMGSIYLFDFGILVLLVVLVAAGLRAVLRPEDGGFAFIRLGMDEVRLVGLALLFFIAMIAIAVVFGILLAIFIGAGVAMAPGAPDASAAPFGQIPASAVVLMLFFYAGIVWLQVRLAPSVALTMIRERIAIGEAWRLTRGHFWPMFGGFLVLGLMLMLGYLALLLLIVAPFFGEIARGFGPGGMAALQQGNVGGLGAFGIVMIVGTIGFAILAGIGIAFWAGGIATATAALLEEEGEGVAAAFE